MDIPKGPEGELSLFFVLLVPSYCTKNRGAAESSLPNVVIVTSTIMSRACVFNSFFSSFLR